MRRNNKYFNVKGGKTIGISVNGNFSFNVGGSAPVAEFTVNNANPNRYQNIQFTDTSTGNPTSWLWDFGDGHTSTDQNPVHSYEYGDASYTVTLTVTNSTGTSTETKTDLIYLDEVTFDTLMRRTNEEFYIPGNTAGYTFNYFVDSPAGGKITGLTDNYTYVKTAAATNTFWRISIGGKYPTFDLSNPFMPNTTRVAGLYRWGTIKWESMENFFINNNGVSGNGYYTNEDVPDLRLVTSMENMFRNTNMRNIKNFSEWDVSTITNMRWTFHTAIAMAEEVDWSDPVRGSINVTTIQGFARNSALTSIKLQAGAVTTAANAFLDASSLTELILIDMSVDFDIATTGLTGAAIDALADSVADMTGQPSPTVTMTQAQLDSCDHSKWLDKNWATVPAHQTPPLTPGAFIMTVNSGQDSEFTIHTEGTGYNYQVETSDGQLLTNQTGDCTITFPETDTDYDIEITGAFPRIYFIGDLDNRLKVLDIKQWGNIEWSSMDRAFNFCKNMIVTATDAPDLSNVTNMYSMFGYCESLTTLNVSNWDVSNVTDMSMMFGQCYSLNALDVSNWDVSSVQNFANWLHNTNVQSDIDFSDPVTGSISATSISNMTTYSNVKSLKLQCSNIAGGSIYEATTNIDTLILIGMRTNVDIKSATSLTGTAIDDLANSVADMTGQATSPMIRMRQSQYDSGIDASIWTNKNWTFSLIG